MSNVVLTIPTAQVEVTSGGATTAASVTNTSDAGARIVLGIFAPVGAEGTVPASATGWTRVERPVREIPPGATEQFTVSFEPPDGTAAGAYAVRVIAYAADGAPEESADQAHRIDVVVPAVAVPPPPRTRWWIYAVAAVLVVAVGVVAFLLLRPGDEPCTGEGCASPSPSASPSASESTPPAPIDGFTWTLVSTSDGTTTAQAVPGREATLRVQDGQVSGTGGCNGYSAPWAQDGDQVEVGTLLSTQKLCLDTPVMQQEQVFLGTLRDVTTLSADETTLTLMTADGRSLVLTR